MSERELCAEIVQSGSWLYDGTVPYEVWIVKQNFEYHYEEGFEDTPEQLNSEGEVFQIVFAKNGCMIALGGANFSLTEAVLAAEKSVSAGILWTNPTLQKLYEGRQYATQPSISE